MPAVMLMAAAPATARAQGWHETQLWGVALASRPAVFAAGLGMSWRDAGRTRIAGAVAAGASDDGRAALRAEATWHFLLDPARVRGLGLYGGGGVALTAIQGATARAFVQAAVGVETGPGAHVGWFLEAGFGGGARIATGIRWRKHNAPGG